MKMEKKILTLKSVRSRWTTLNGQGWDSPKEEKVSNVRYQGISKY
jgi:hypothetical protein